MRYENPSYSSHPQGNAVSTPHRFGGATLGLRAALGEPSNSLGLTCESPRALGSSHTAGGGGVMTLVTLADMTADSNLIVEGTVMQLQSCTREGGPSIVTLVSIAPHQVIQAAGSIEASEGLVTIVVSGGEFGDYRLNVGTSPEFTVGEQVVVFLREIDDVGLVLTEGFQSKFSITADGIVNGIGLPVELRMQNTGLASARHLNTEQDPLDTGRGIVQSAFVVEVFKWSTDDIPVPIWINAESGRPAQISAEETRMAAADALHTWQKLPESFIAFGPIGNTARVSGADGCSETEDPDGFIDITWGIESGDPDHGESTLQVTWTCWGTQTNELLDADIEIDTDHVGAGWRVDGTGDCGSDLYDLETVFLHEIGHLVGLTHPTAVVCTIGLEEDKCPALNVNYMGVLRDPCADDIAGVASIYPMGGGPPPPIPTGLAAAAANSIGLAWNDVAGEIGYEIWRAVGDCASVAPEDFVLLDSVDEDVTSYTDTDYGNGLTLEQAYCYKIRAFSTEGVSDFSNTVEATEGVIPQLFGDIDCDGDVDSVDSLKTLRFVAGLPFGQTEPCPDVGSEVASIFGDIDCDDDVDSVDSLKLLRFVAGLPFGQIEPCPEVGSPVQLEVP